jgi:hypothetical protein
VSCGVFSRRMAIENELSYSPSQKRASLIGGYRGSSDVNLAHMLILFSMVLTLFFQFYIILIAS